ncbi:UrcA family protein [Sphingomonadaceae bacterium]|nr:UrcA family protein [Sphingomonadaceae bacterium]
MKNPLIALTIASAMAGSLMAATPAAAESVSIQWRDLNLETVEGQRALDGRIKRAARKVCGMDSTELGSRIQSSKVRKCFREAEASARKQVAVMREETRMGG